MDGSSATPQNVIMDLVLSRMKTDVLHAVNKLGIADIVHELEPQADLKSIATKLNVQPHGLRRLLNACVALGLLEIKKSAETQDFYQTTLATQEWLLKSSEKSLSGLLTFDELYETSLRIKVADAVLQGDNRMQENVFQLAEDDPEVANILAEGMAGFAVKSTSLARAFDLSAYKTAIDIGGGVGVFAQELKKIYPKMEVNVFDLPSVVKQADIYWTKRHIKPDITFFNGDMFKGPVPNADLYVLGHILHDWEDAKCRQILENISKSINPGGAILILEKLLPETPSTNTVLESMWDMYMLRLPLLAEERTLQQFSDLLEPIGFGIDKFKKISGCICYDATLATKKE